MLDRNINDSKRTINIWRELIVSSDLWVNFKKAKTKTSMTWRDILSIKTEKLKWI
jgi:hypothetical protein